MEKQAVIRPGVTPEVNSAKNAKTANTKSEQIKRLDNDLTKRMSDTAAANVKKSGT